MLLPNNYIFYFSRPPPKITLLLLVIVYLKEVIMDYLSLFTEMLQARGLADNTIRNYQTYIKLYLAYLQRLGISPDAASWQAMRDYLRYIKEARSLSDRTVNMVISHLQFFHVYVLHRQWDPTQVPFRRFRSYLPYVPSREIVRSFIASLEDPKMKLAVSILYATGLRLDELCHLKCRDIYLEDGKVHISDSQNRQDRYVPLPASLKPLILSYWYSFPAGSRPREWLFTQQRSLSSPMDKQWVQERIIRQREKLGIDGRLTAHSFRHAFATHSYENGLDLLSLKTFLGHRSTNSTSIYVHLAASSSCQTINPFDQIGGGTHA